MTNQQQNEIQQMKELSDYLIQLAVKSDSLGLRFLKAVQFADKKEMTACFKIAFDHRQKAYQKMLNNLDACNEIIAKELHAQFNK